MKYLLGLIFCLSFFVGISQTVPAGLPSPRGGFSQYAYGRDTILTIVAVGDTTIRPTYTGSTRIWVRSSSLTQVWSWDGTKWVMTGSSSGGGGACDSCITNISYRSGTYVDTLYYTNSSGDVDWYYIPVMDGFLVKPTVTYTGYERTYYVSQWVARIGGVLVMGGDTTITLVAPSADSSRSDLFVATITGITTTVTGTESANPIQPGYTFGTQLPITYVLLTPTAESGITDSLIVYNEQNVGEFLNVTGTGVTVNPANTLNPYVGSKAISVGAINNADIIGIGRTVSVNVSGYQALAFAIKLNQVMPNSNGMLVSIWSNGTQVSQEIGIPFNRTQLTYQLFSISLSTLSLTNTIVDSIRFRYSGGGSGMASGMYIDYVYFERGIPGGGAGNFVQDVFERNDTLYQVKDGIEYFVAELNAGTVQSITGDSPITVDNTDPANPIVGIIDPLPVANGGTGVVSISPYGVMVGGATSTGPIQNAGTGSTGQLLMSNGSSALPTWFTPTYILPADTAAMLANYKRSIGYGLSGSGNFVQADSTVLINQARLNNYLALKMSYADTASMLASYIYGVGLGLTKPSAHYVALDTASSVVLSRQRAQNTYMSNPTYFSAVNFAFRFVPGYSTTTANAALDLYSSDALSSSRYVSIASAPTTGWYHSALSGSFLVSGKNGAPTALPMYIFSTGTNDVFNDVPDMTIGADEIIVGTSTLVTSARFAISSTTKGFLMPQHTIAQRNAVSSPAANLKVTSTELDIDNDYNGTVWTVNDGTIFTQTADKNINTTASETTLFGTGSGTLTIPANYLYSGNTVTIKLEGYMTTDGTPTLDIKFKLGSTTITSTGATTLVSVASNGRFIAECTLTARASPGASAAIMGQGEVKYYSAATTANNISAMSTATVNAATNGSLAIDATATFGTSHANNKIVITNAFVQIKN